MSAAANIGKDVLGGGANVASLLTALRSPGGLQQSLIQRAEALQDPGVRQSLMGNRFMSRALGVGGQTLPVVPGRETFVPNLPQLGAEQQAGVLASLAKLDALRARAGGTATPQQLTELGLRGVPSAGIPGGSTLATRGGQQFLQDPRTQELTKIGAVPKQPVDLTGMMKAIGSLGPDAGKRVMVDSTGKVAFTQDVPARAQATAKGRRDAAFDLRSAVEELTPQLQPFASGDIGISARLGVSPTADWTPDSQAEFFNLMKDAGIIDPRTGQTPTIDSLTKKDGSGEFDREAYDALASGGIMNAVDRDLGLIE